MFGSFGMLEIGLILIVGIVVFGAMKLPRLARNLSSGFGELKKLKKGFDLGLDDDDPPPRQHTQNYGPAPGPYNQPYQYGNPGQQDFAQGQQTDGQANPNQYYGQQGYAPPPPQGQPPPPSPQGQQPPPEEESDAKENPGGDDKKTG